jgi:hypothetical protein
LWPGPGKHFRRKRMFRGRPLKPRFLTLPDILGEDVFYVPMMGPVNPPVNREYFCEKLVRRPGFEPGITGLEGRRPNPG